MNKQIKRILFLSLMAIIVLAGCGNQSTSSNDTVEESAEKIKIVTTFYPMYEFTKQVAGDYADVELLIPASQEPHGWEPSPQDMANVQSADLFIYNSDYMETFVETVRESVEDSKVKFVEASEGISLMEGTEEEEHDHSSHEEEHAESEEHDHSSHEEEHAENTEHQDEEDHEHEEEHSHEYDPHVWLSPVLAIKEVESITQSLIEADPNNKEAYEENSNNYIAQLEQLDNKYREALNNLDNKEIITQHASFGYLTKEYGLTQIAIAGLSPELEPSAEKLAQLKEYATEHAIDVIYFEETASSKVAETLATEIGAKTEVLHTLESLTQEDQGDGLDYIKVMEQNLEILTN